MSVLTIWTVGYEAARFGKRPKRLRTPGFSVGASQQAGKEWRFDIQAKASLSDRKDSEMIGPNEDTISFRFDMSRAEAKALLASLHDILERT